MKINLIAVGSKMPAWVDQGYQEYARRMPAECQLVLKEISAQQRGKNAPIKKLLLKEGQQILSAIPKGSGVIALEVTGKRWTTEDLAKQLQGWMAAGRDQSLLIGGPEGLHSDCVTAAEQRWSLSSLTFPHPLVRVIVAEQIYRAWSIINNHPYHRG